MKRIRDDNELLEIHKNGVGFIYNDYAGLTRFKEHNKLHEANCPTCSPNNPVGMRAKIAKFFFEDLNEAKDWLNSDRKDNWVYCGTCMGYK